jgi:voltage-gated potassium channel
MAATALRPLAVDFMELLAGSDCEVEEFQISDDPSRVGAYNGRTLADLEIKRRTGALVLAVRSPATQLANPYHYRGTTLTHTESKLIANPSGNLRLAPGQLMVVMGSKEQLASFAHLLGPALDNVNPMLG